MTGPWEKLVATALVGTDRQTPDASGLEGALGPFVEQLNPNDAEGLVLGMGGAIATYTQAGIQASEYTGPVPDPCEAEDFPICSDLITQQLQRVLSGPYRQVLPELLASLKEARQLVPAHYLPLLLELGRQQSHLRAVIEAVIGKRGRWLAAHNPSWRYVSEDIDVADPEAQAQAIQENWDTGTLATRLAVLRSLRETAPAQGRALLETSWKQEKAKDRTEFLKLLDIGLSSEDEPFLEAALDDRSKDVRPVAAALLSQLPSSQLCTRMMERIKPLMELETTAKELVLKVKLPDEPDQSAIRDGLLNQKMYRLGQRASLLMQMIGAVPLQFWEDQAPIETLIQAAGQHKWRAGLLKGWEIAAQRQGNPRWGRALMTHALKQETVAELEVNNLLALLPFDEREALMEQWLTRLWPAENRSVWRTTVAAIAQSGDIPSLGFSRFLFAGLKADFRATLSSSKPEDYPYRLRAYIMHLAFYLDVEVCHEADDLQAALNADDLDTYRRETVRQLLEILHFRLAIKQAFAHLDS